MYQSVARYLREAGLDDPVVCYQGAVVADADGTFLRHVPIPLDLAREAVEAVTAAGVHLNAYVDDELYVAEVTPEARQYADFQHIPLHVVGDLRTWLREPPTKLVAVGERRAMDAFEEQMKALLGDRLYISKSLPEFVEFASPDVNKASGLQFLADRLGFTPETTVAFGDGENDVELVGWAGYGVAVANAHDRVLAAADFVCPSDEEEGVAQVLEAYLDSRA
jgi:Cof subfamily protein (haloacid dehalogenase superfamily)